LKVDEGFSTRGGRATDSKGYRLVDVLAIWGYRVEQLAANHEADELINCARALIPSLNKLMLSEEIDLGLRAEAARTACSIALALSIVPDDKSDIVAPLLKKSLKGIVECLRLPVAVQGRHVAAQTLSFLA